MGQPDVGAVDSFWRQGLQVRIKAHYDCIQAFSETDFTADLLAFDIPTLILHGDDDQIVPAEISAHKSARLIPQALLRIIPGGAHGMCTVSADIVNQELLDFITQ